ncbi:MAG: hypothetical protein ACRCZF_04105, partial [Gemmataceae bacterium]
MPLFLGTPGETVTLAEQLHTVARSRRTARLTTGVFAFLTLGILGVTIAVAGDYLFSLSPAFRAGGLGIWLAGLLSVYARFIRRPAAEPVDALRIAHLLESQHPHLNDSLASAVSFQLLEEAGQTSALGHRRFREVAIIRATNLTNRIEPEDLIPSTGALVAFAAACFTCLIGLGVAIWLGPTHGAAGLARFFRPYGTTAWPAQTRLEILAPIKNPALLAKGEPFSLQFKLEGVVPTLAELDVRYSANDLQTEIIPLEGVTAGTPVSWKLEPSRVARDFEFRVRANDATSAWFSVRVLPAPKLVPLGGRPSPQMTLFPPAYTRLPITPLPDGAGVIETVSGTRVRLLAATDRAIVSAKLIPQAEGPGLALAQAVAHLGAESGLGSVGADELAQLYRAPIAVAVKGPEQNHLEVEFQPLLPGLYTLQFTDGDGLTGTRLFDFRTYLDPAPTVQLERPAEGKDPLMVLPTATVPMIARAEDRLFAARQLLLEVRINDESWTSKIVADASVASQLLPFTNTAQPQPIVLQGQRTLRLTELRHANGAPLADGDTLTLRAAATDWDDRTLQKTPGRSPEVTIRILSVPSFEAHIQKNLAKLRPELARELADQEQVQRDVKALSEKLPKEAQPLSPEQREQLAKVDQNQRSVQNRLTDPRDGVRAKAEELRGLIQGNELPKSPTTERAEGFAKNLARADEKPLNAAAQELARAKERADQKDSAGVKE